MSILIKGMEMPKSCDVCGYCNDDYICNNFVADCYGLDVSDYVACRHDDCPLVEIPPHGNLIDKDKLVNVLFDLLDDSDKPVHDMLLEVETAPTVIESEGQENEL